MKKYGLIVLCMMLAGLSIAYAQNNTYYFPQVANGTFAGGIFKTTIILTNTGTVDAAVQIRLTDDNGNALSFNFSRLGSGSTFNVSLPKGNTLLAQSDGAGGLAAGAVTITSDNPIGATAIFSQFDPSGSLQTEAGVTSARGLRSFTIPVELSGAFNYNTGLAFFKPGSGSANVALTIFDQDGTQRGQGNLTLGGNGHKAAFAPDFFGSLSGFTRGSMVVTSDNDIAAVALRTGFGSGPVITTLPVTDPQTAFSFPQMADGTFAGGSFKTTLILINSGTSSATANVQLTTDFPGLQSGMVTLAPHSTRVLESSRSGGLADGGATVTSQGTPIVAAVIFSQFDGAGNLQTEAGVASARTMRALTIPVDISNPFNTGVALFKSGAGSANIMLRLLDASGALKAQGTSQLGANGHRAAFVDGLFPGITGFDRGSLSITSDNDIFAVALRSGSGTGPVLTTLPVIDGAYIPPAITTSFAGSFDGPFTADGPTDPNDRITFVMQQNGNTVTGRMVQEFASQQGCIVASEFTAPVTGSSFQATARALDSTTPSTTLDLTISADLTTITGTFRTSACTPSPLTGRISARKMPVVIPPDATGTFTGGVWNAADGSRSFGYVRSRLNGRDFIVDEIGVQTPIGIVTGTATGRLNEAGDRIENLNIRLMVAGTTLTINGEVSLTSDGKSFFGGLQTPPGELLDVHGSTVMRRP